MSKRIQRVNQLVKYEVSQAILKEGVSPKDVLVTVTRAETSPDLKQSSVFISVIPGERKDEAINLLNRKIYWLQQKINKRLKIRPVPKITFTEEKKTKQAARVEEILEGLKKEYDQRFFNQTIYLHFLFFLFFIFLCGLSKRYYRSKNTAS